MSTVGFAKDGNSGVVPEDGFAVNVKLPRLPYVGPIGLQHHGLGPVVGAAPGETRVPVQIQFRNLRIKEY